MEETIDLLAETGWNGWFAVWKPGDDLRPFAARGASLGLAVQSVHAPWGRAADLWGADEAKGEASVEELLACLRAAAEIGAPFVVAHAWIGFTPTEPTEAGLARFARVADEAERLGVPVALENTEGEEHLDALLARFAGHPAVGFCWDTGHELCYNRGRDLMAPYGARLLGTHLNDNLGISDPAGPTTWLDDLHLLPFDGVADWPGIAARLARSGFAGPLTFELNRASKPNRHENDAYGAMLLRDYLAEALVRARRVAALVEGERTEAPSAAVVVEGGIAKFPAGRTPDAARAEAEAAYGRAPSDRVWRIDEGTSLDEVNAAELAPGTTVLFKRGGVWRGQLRVRSGTPGHPVTYGAWGEGPAPIIQPSLDRGAPGDWRREPDGLWRAETGAATDIGNVVLDHGDEGCLFKRDRREQVLRDRDFWFDPATGGVLVRSDAGNPAARWRSIELARKLHCVDEAGAHDVVYEGLAVRYGAAHGFGGGGVKRIAIRRCEVSWIGGGILYVDDLGNGVRYGNGIELWGSAEDVTVEECRVRQCFDAGLTNQSSEPGTAQRRIFWGRNEVAECEYSYEFWVQGEGSVVEDLRIDSNVFRDAGAGWGREQRWNPSAAHLRFQDTTASVTPILVEGNRFRRSADVLARIFNDWRGELRFACNDWESAGEPLCLWHARPRAGLRFLCPDYLDRNHRDDRAEIEADGPGGRVFEATPEGSRAFRETFVVRGTERFMRSDLQELATVRRRGGGGSAPAG